MLNKSQGITTESDVKRTVIDVSHNQGKIDFEKVKATGVTGVIIRGGYRGYGTAQLTTDSCFHEYMQDAIAAGLTVGAYYVTQAINEEEAREEARYLVELCKPYKITEKLAIDVEWAGNKSLGEEGRANSLSKEARTTVINAWADEIRKLGYEPMCYANKYWFTAMIAPEINCPAWVAHYYDNADISKKYELAGYEVCGWQYSSSHSIDGVSSARVDTDVFYYDVSAPVPEPTPQPEPQPTTLHKVGELVEYDTIYASSDSTKALKPLYTTGTITRVLEGKRNPYLIDNGTGWLNDDCIVSQPAYDDEIRVGDKVKVLNAVTYTGTPFNVYYNVYDVIEVKGDRVVIGIGSVVTAAIKAEYLEKV